MLAAEAPSSRPGSSEPSVSATSAPSEATTAEETTRTGEGRGPEALLHPGSVAPLKNA